MRSLIVRFLAVTAAALGAQVVVILAWASIRGDASGLVTIIYRPFFAIAGPFIERYSGGSDGSLGYWGVAGVVLGALVYSITVGFLALLFRHPSDEQEPIDL